MVLIAGFLAADTARKDAAKILQEMSWVDVQDYLKTNDMVIIPLGSTEQHGPHLPLGSDYFLAREMSKEISRKTGVVVAPVLTVGYSRYHGGFPGTLSLTPDTMVQVLFETSQMLIGHGFHRILFFNFHGGNNIVQTRVIHRINHETEAVAVAIAEGGSIHESLEPPEGIQIDFFDWHAGKDETSMLLAVRPDLVRMDRAEKPQIHMTSRMEKIGTAAEDAPSLAVVFEALLAVPSETGKGGASHELSSNGVWSFNDPNDATAEHGQKRIDYVVEGAVRFIEAWKTTEPVTTGPAASE